MVLSAREKAIARADNRSLGQEAFGHEGDEVLEDEKMTRDR